MQSRRSFLAMGAAFAATPVSAQQRLPSHTITENGRPFYAAVAPVHSQDLGLANEVNVFIVENSPLQPIEGFGGCFSELGWVALTALATQDREHLLEELFAPSGGNFSFCRLPIGANDFARNWYSCDESTGDFAMQNFTIARDQQMQIPFIQAAQAHRPDLRFWASPWSPPTWMKTNGHYACSRQMFPGMPDNGLKPDQVGSEGHDSFIQDDRYFSAYALYFRKFIDAYRGLGIPISMVVPQNEFNSCQPYPSCCWTTGGLTRFIPFLGRQLRDTGTKLFCGTLERPDDSLLDRVLSNPDAARYIEGVALQWAGRRAAPFVHHDHPQLAIYQSEQECGDGKNDWRFARYTWTLMKSYMNAGAQAYDYWNIATPKGGLSSWGWPQNALISVDLETRTSWLNPDYYVFKHLSHFVLSGARRLDSFSVSGYDNLLAFRNPNGDIVIIIQNDMVTPTPINIAVKGKVFSATLPADSFNTLVI